MTNEQEIFTSVIQKFVNSHHETLLPATAASPTSPGGDEDGGDLEIRNPMPWTYADPPIQVGENGSFFGTDAIHPIKLGHVAVLGETGAGKTSKVMVPLLKGALRYRLTDGKQAAVLVVDPKRELLSVVENTLAEIGQENRLHKIGDSKCGPVRIFEPGSRESVHDRWHKIEAFMPATQFNGDHAYWHENGMTAVRKLTGLQQKAADSDPNVRLLNEWAAECGIPLNSTSSLVALEAILPKLMTYGAENFRQPLRTLKKICARHGISEQEASFLDMYGQSSTGFDQFLYIVTCSRPMLSTLADPSLNRLVDLDPVPDPNARRVSLLPLMESGKVVVIQPSLKAIGQIAGRAIKSRAQACVYARMDQLRPVLFFADEFHRYLTNDRESGDQCFLDRARGFRASMIYATQSIYSMEEALGSDKAAESATKIVLANTGTRFFLRTTDPGTAELLKRLVADPPGSPYQLRHIVDTRRPASLRTGQAYVLWADGTWTLR